MEIVFADMRMRKMDTYVNQDNKVDDQITTHVNQVNVKAEQSNDENKEDEHGNQDQRC